MNKTSDELAPRLEKLVAGTGLTPIVSAFE